MAVKRWPEAELRDLLRRLEAFLTTCRPTSLAARRRSPFQLLVSCVISLRTKDEVTAVASRRLLELAPTPSKLAGLDDEAIAEAIYPAGFYRRKARQLRGIGRILQDRHRGRVPSTIEELLALPGVGRKTANLVRGLGFGQPAICVDTHVHRISNRLGLVRTESPEATERALERLLPRAHWIPINELMVCFGQHQCRPTSPRCSSCPLEHLCPRVGVGRFR